MGSKAREGAKAVESCVCIAGFSACGCQKKSVVYETECRHVAVQRGKQDQKSFVTFKHIQATLYCIRFQMRSHCSFSRRSVKWWWRGAKRTSVAAKLKISG